MTNTEEVKKCFKNLLGWKQFYNSSIVIEEALTETVTGEYYQDFHPSLALNIISQSLDKGRDLSQYLGEKVDVGVTQLMNDIQAKRISEGDKEILASTTLLNKYGWANDIILTESRFVGFMFNLANQIGITAAIESFALQVSTEQAELNIYLYHSSQLEPVKVMKVALEKAISWNWIQEEITLYARNKNIQGGNYYIGYYQDDLLGQAINYTDFNWNSGYCGTCSGVTMKKQWDNLRKYLYFMPIYVPNANLDPDRNMFDQEAVMIDASKSWGMNFKLSVVCDYTDFFCSNKKTLKNALGYKVAFLIMQDIKYSQQFNYINEDIKSLIIRDLEGDKDTYNFGIPSKLKQELNNVYFNTSSINKTCLPCAEKDIVEYGAV